MKGCVLSGTSRMSNSMAWPSVSIAGQVVSSSGLNGSLATVLGANCHAACHSTASDRITNVGVWYQTMPSPPGSKPRR